MPHYAHTPNPSGQWHELKDHLCSVSQKAAAFARSFGGSDEACVAGLLHDLGKYRDEFQRYLQGERQSGFDTHHSVYGAAFALAKDWPCALAIAGHHAGLQDRHRLQDLVHDPKYNAKSQFSSLEERLRREGLEVPSTLSFPVFLRDNPHSWEFYIRMLFSCLVDADRLDTEEHQTGKPRPSTRLSDIAEQLLASVLAERASKPKEGIVNHARNVIFEQCLNKARERQGFFSLTVPTGAGKTLAGMAFALAHARQWSLDRVTVVIPYLSIIEQNAAEYRRILDPDKQGIVVEHHSAVPVSESKEKDEISQTELAAENWDAPIIVTTSVQFVESLFASAPSKCRKLHNIANSVVILDEVQLLPTHLLNPLMSVLRELRENYKVSFLFMTATQPAFRQHPICLSEGLKAGEMTPIVSDEKRVFDILKRVDYKREGELDWATLAQRIAAQPQVLCVVNIRRHAFELWEALREVMPEEERESIFHLSSAMCAEHRLFVLGEIGKPREGSIRHRLKSGLPCRLVSTQVVEAGVDVDFPVVYRALGPLDSIIQAAGRCNREGRLTGGSGNRIHGCVVIFTPSQKSLPKGVYKTATSQTEAFLTSRELNSLNEPNTFEEYFSQYLQLIDTDHSCKREVSIQEDREEWRFREVSRKARVIKDEGCPVIVPYECGKQTIAAIRTREPVSEGPRFTRYDLRSLQRFMVNVRTDDFKRLKHFRMVSELLPNLELYVLEEGCYHEHLGLLIENRPMEDFLL